MGPANSGPILSTSSPAHVVNLSDGVQSEPGDHQTKTKRRRSLKSDPYCRRRALHYTTHTLLWSGLCIVPPCPPPPVYMIDVTALPEAPPGSDADRIARGLAPRGSRYDDGEAALVASEQEAPATDPPSPEMAPPAPPEE